LSRSTSIDVMLLFQEKPEVVVEKIVRNKRKCVTIIKGLDMFGKCNVIGWPIFTHLGFSEDNISEVISYFPLLLTYLFCSRNHWM